MCVHRNELPHLRRYTSAPKTASKGSEPKIRPRALAGYGMNLKIFPECFVNLSIEESMNIYWLKMYIIVKFIWCDLIGLDLIHSKKESRNTEMWSNPIQTAWYQPSFLHTIKTKENTQKQNLMPWCPNGTKTEARMTSLSYLGTAWWFTLDLIPSLLNIEGTAPNHHH